ncbi:putative pentatricopeptide repeat-containing protein At3g49142 [Corylus avellana]|uniref:putative pentatricopeptide repeat-containing protein At3g49142 n=1 Tax=Corylus avellana TaxID=13451 RepID=UPI001E23945E|nr:putative pentatricopeptide repeat-containing protein At3g49142 [Corylus avellana]XP_059434001.1 putative pentatricopeptide repeat-containing protein At3g49142 [Corylus avellana]
MKSINPFSRHFSIARQLQNLVSSTQKSTALTEELCGNILDQCPDIKTLKKLHSRIIVDQRLRSNPSLGIKLMRAYAAYGEPSLTRQVFDEIPDKNVVFFNVMIRSYVNNHLYCNALLVYKTMANHGFEPDNYTYPCVLKACSGLDDLRVGLQIHGAVVKVGLDLNLFIGNGLVAMYGKCGCLVEARRVLDEMPSRDVVSWNSMVAGYSQNARFDEALEVCKEMEVLRLKPDAGTMASLLPAVTNTTSNNVSYVKDMFMKLAKKSVVSWNVMVAVYVNNSMPGEAVNLYLQMEECGIEPDAVTIASVLPACGDLSALSLGRRMHEYVERKKLRPNLLLENALVDMYAKCGSLRDAREVFDRMKFRDVVSWTSVISAYGLNGQGRDAVALFAKMQDSGLCPDSIAFVSVISACSHAGLLEEGRYYFKLMTEEYRIIPRIEHFACMVDLLGRSGQVDEAYHFIKQMPVAPNERVWGALLSACRVYSNMNVGLLAADHLFELNPEQSGYYVLLSNIYAKAGRWQDVTTIRSIMKSRGIKKMPGISNVELNHQIHTFLAGDQSHPQSEEIYEELDVLVGKMKELGYVPETDSALHDVEEEDKECHLAVHSEKLAIVFAILNTEPGMQIRITKNLRVCGDCHIAAKLISKIVEREIIVRDTNRFHHFKNGICSCGDYW